MREKTHRLLRNFYQGFVSVAFTLVLKHPSFRFDSLETVKAFTEILEEAAVNEKCRVPVYCFMPDHQHLILEGTDSGSDVWKVIVKYKQKTGYRACRTLGGTIWQKDFYDHIIRKDENLVTQSWSGKFRQVHKCGNYSIRTHRRNAHEQKTQT